ncbi:MAG TPA: glycosyltransferase [Terracidiphilus sp.]|nr:glycosyltransferase [Terracidiphilus sp.]
MHLVIFGLTISSSWGNGHATLWRALIKALARRRHTITFFEHHLPYYASARDNWVPPPGVRVRCYPSLDEITTEAMQELNSADLALSTSYCPDGPAVSELILDSRAAIKAFYDLDTPVTLDAARQGPVAYLPSRGLGDFDLVLSYTGGRALTELATCLGARSVAPLYGSADPEAHFPAEPVSRFRGILSYLGTYTEDRRQSVEKLFFETASRMPEGQFMLGGAQYPSSTPWRPNVNYIPHVPPPLHPAFFCSSRATINITRGVMAAYGYCPSGRMFEAAACGAPLLSDKWDGLEMFFEPGEEVLLVEGTEDVVQALSLPDAELRKLANAARDRVLAEHTPDRRAMELESLCTGVLDRVQPRQGTLSPA